MSGPWEGLWIEWGKIHFESDQQQIRLLYNGEPLSPWRQYTIQHIPGTTTPYRGEFGVMYP